MRVESYKNLIVWQKAMDLVTAVYRITANFPREEIYGLSSQIKRAAVSIPSNIAEGSRRSSKKDFRNFLLVAFGSGSELETQLEIAKRLSFVTPNDSALAENLLSEVMKMINKLSDSMNA